MTFELGKFITLGGQTNGRDAYQKFGYLGDVDGIATVVASGYFNEVKTCLRVGNIIEVLDQVAATDAYYFLEVTTLGLTGDVEVTQLGQGESTEYLKLDGSNAMSGDFDGGGNDLTNVGAGTFAGDVYATRSAAGQTVLARVFNTENTDAASNAELRIICGNNGQSLIQFADGAAYRASIVAPSSGDELQFKTSSSLTTALTLDSSQNATFAGTVTVGAYTLPATDGTSGQVLTTNGSGVLTWTTP